ncbi:MAG: hypothetical protein RSA40_01170 [Malacoplasma sp.]
MKENNNTTNSSIEYTTKILNKNNVSNQEQEILYTIDYNNVSSALIDNIGDNEQMVNIPKFDAPEQPFFNDTYNNQQPYNDQKPYVEPAAFPPPPPPPFFPLSGPPKPPPPISTINTQPLFNPQEPILDTGKKLYEKLEPIDSIYLSKRKIKEMCQEKKIKLSEFEIDNIYRDFYEKKLNELDLNTYLNSISINKSDDKLNLIDKHDEKLGNVDNSILNKNPTNFFDGKESAGDIMSKNKNFESSNENFLTRSRNGSNYDFDYGRMKDVFKLTLLEEEQKKYHLDAQLEKMKHYMDERLSLTESILQQKNLFINGNKNKSNGNNTSFDFNELLNKLNHITNNLPTNLNENVNVSNDNESSSIKENIEPKDKNSSELNFNANRADNFNGNRYVTPIELDNQKIKFIPSDEYIKDKDLINKLDTFVNNLSNVNINKDAINQESVGNTSSVTNTFNEHSTPEEHLTNIVKNDLDNSHDELLSNSIVENNDKIDNAVISSLDNKSYVDNVEPKDNLSSWPLPSSNSTDDVDNLANPLDINLDNEWDIDANYIYDKLSDSLHDISLIKEIVKDKVDKNLEKDLDKSIELFENVRN